MAPFIFTLPHTKNLTMYQREVTIFSDSTRWGIQSRTGYMKLSLGLKNLVWSCMLQRGSQGSCNQSFWLASLFSTWPIQQSSSLYCCHNYEYKTGQAVHFLRLNLWENLIFSAYLVNRVIADFQKIAWMRIICIPRLRIKVWKFSEIIK